MTENNFQTVVAMGMNIGIHTFQELNQRLLLSRNGEAFSSAKISVLHELPLLSNPVTYCNIPFHLSESMHGTHMRYIQTTI